MGLVLTFWQGELETQRAAELRAVAEFDLTISNEDAKFAQWR